jgi:hypothetical protein
MNLLLGLDRLIPPARGHRSEPTTRGTAGDREAGYVLVYNPPDAPAPGHRRGWTLHARPARPRDWSTSLAGHGAGIHTGPRAAKAVAVRVLADRGVAVSGWADRPDVTSPGIVMFTARTRSGHRPASDSADTDRGPRTDGAG